MANDISILGHQKNFQLKKRMLQDLYTSQILKTDLNWSMLLTLSGMDSMLDPLST